MTAYTATAPSDAPLPDNVHVSSHPLIHTKLSFLRQANPEDTGSAHTVKLLVDSIGALVASEALATNLSTQDAGPATAATGHPFTHAVVSSPIALVPILRSGLGLLPAIETVLYPTPFAVHHLGLYRDSASGRPVEYYNNFTKRPQGSAPPVAIIVDPIIATGQTMCAAIDTVVEWGATKIVIISVLASDSGLRKVAAKASPNIDLSVWTGGCDGRTDDRGMLVPGMGDVGDRMFGTIGK